VPAIGDIDGDCDLDVVYNKAAIRGTDGTVMWGNPSAGFGATFCILADLDDNCTVEVVTGCGVFNATTGAVIWQLTSCSQNGWFAPAPRVGDFSPASPGKEIVLAGAYNINNPINMFAGITGTPLWSFSMAGLNHTAEGVSIGDIDNDGCVEIVIAPDCCNGSNTVLALDDNGNASQCGILASIGQVDFFPHDTTACNCVDFFDFSSQCANNWSWSFPGGTPSTSTAQNPGTVCYATPGTYTATMIAHLNACAAADTIVHTITIITCGVAPVAQFLSSDTTICANECINFTDMTTNIPTSWSWSFPGGVPSTSTDQNPQGICYPAGGTYDVTLVAGNAGGTDSVTLTGYIFVHPAPPAPVITQSGDTLSVPGAYTSYQWYFGSDTIVGATNSSYVATQSGNYNIAVTDENGCVVGTGILNVIAAAPPDLPEGEEFAIVPNPAWDEFTVYGLPLGDCEIEIYNSLGEKVFSVTLSEVETRKSKTINCKDFAEGIYVVQVKSERGILNAKFVVEK
jgi:PKD repeat protein